MEEVPFVSKNFRPPPPKPFCPIHFLQNHIPISKPTFCQKQLSIEICHHPVAPQVLVKQSEQDKEEHLSLRLRRKRQAESTTCNVLLSLPSPRIWWVWNKLRDLPIKSLGYNHGHGLKGRNSNGCHYISVALHQAPSTPQTSHHTQAVHEVPHSSTTAKRTNRQFFWCLKKSTFPWIFVSCCLEKVGKQRFCLPFFVANGKVGSWK